MKKLLISCNLFLIFFVCQNYVMAQVQPSQGEQKGLKDYFKGHFKMGVAVSPYSLRGKDSALIVSEFNSITPENAMKMGPLHPEENRYNWKDADAIVDFAQRHNLGVRGHNLLWHEQAPKWMFTNDKGELVSKEVLLKRLKDHITTVVNRYKGKIYAWDVVNEAIDDDPNNLLRKSLWYQICGEDFITKAFEYAHEADPNAILVYNDYNSERPEKRDRIYTLLKKLVDNKVPIHAVGLQGHWSIYEPTEQELRDAIKKYSSLGLKVHFTEVDMSIYPWEKERREKRPTDIDTYTPELEQKQIAQYRMIFNVFKEFKDVVTGVTFWNVADNRTWLDSYPVPGRKNYPLLFDTNHNKKKAYWEVVKTVSK